MAGLSDLANETLLQIFEYLKPAKEDISWSNQPKVLANLHNVAITCRQFSLLAQSYLFADVSFFPLESLDQARRFFLFCESVQRNPSLGLHVRGFGFSFKLKGKAPFVDKTCRPLMSALFKRLPRLTALQLYHQTFGLDGCEIPQDYCVDWGAFASEFISQCLAESPLKFLKNVVLGGACLKNVQVISKFMAVDTVERIEISTLNSEPHFRGDQSHRLMSNGSGPMASNIQTLSLGYGLPMLDLTRRGVLRVLLEMSPRLESLWIGGPSVHPETYSPQTLQYSLEPAIDNLVSLMMDIEGDDNISHFPDFHDGSTLDLSRFKSLKTVSLSAACLFTTARPHASRSHMIQLLPGTIEELVISLEYDTRVIDIDAEKDTIAASDYQWILELARRKHVHFPQLATITIETIYYEPGPFVRWEQPKLHSAEFPEEFRCQAASGWMDDFGTYVNIVADWSKWQIPSILATSLEEADIKFSAEIFVAHEV